MCWNGWDRPAFSPGAAPCSRRRRRVERRAAHFGRVVGEFGRDVIGEANPKYLNAAETLALYEGRLPALRPVR